MDIDIVPGTASDIFGVDNIDDGNPWVEQTAKRLGAHKTDWGHDSKVCIKIDFSSWDTVDQINRIVRYYRA